WLLMAATLVRLMAETAFFGLYSRHKDREIWMGNGIFLFASLLLNLILVPLLGLTGLGLSSIVASVILLALRQGGLRSLQAECSDHSADSRFTERGRHALLHA